MKQALLFMLTVNLVYRSMIVLYKYTKNVKLKKIL